MKYSMHVLNRQARLLHPALWHMTLARSYLATGDVEAIVAMVRLCASKIGKGPGEDYEVYVCKVIENIRDLAHQYHPNLDQVLNFVIYQIS